MLSESAASESLTPLIADAEVKICSKKAEFYKHRQTVDQNMTNGEGEDLELDWKRNDDLYVCSRDNNNGDSSCDCLKRDSFHEVQLNTNKLSLKENDSDSEKVLENETSEHLEEKTMQTLSCRVTNEAVNLSKVVVDVEGRSQLYTPQQESVQQTKMNSNLKANLGENSLVSNGLTKSNTCENCGQELNKNKQKELEASHSGCSLSSFSKFSESSADFCRICHCEGDNEFGSLIAPCKCKGTLAYVHHSCLQHWIKNSDSKNCELCGFYFTMNSKLKPFRKWEKLSMSTSERRKLVCSVIFHIIAITCVVWSLQVLIEKTAEELKSGTLQWPFWTKLVVVAVGFTGGLVFMYMQCKVYVHLWKRLKAFNRIIYVQNQPAIAETPQEHFEERSIHSGSGEDSSSSSRVSCGRDDVIIAIGDSRCHEAKKPA